jgi:stearoyl-CoA desaturase (delta-9 desaturase)
MLLLLLNLLCFGYWGILIWAAQMIWIPFWAAGVVNGLGHWWGYRNGETKDRSRNIFPIGLWIGGEELHNNHHLSPGDPRLSLKWWEFDVGWMWIRILSSLRLAEIRSVS